MEIDIRELLEDVQVKVEVRKSIDSSSMGVLDVQGYMKDNDVSTCTQHSSLPIWAQS